MTDVLQRPGMRVRPAPAAPARSNFVTDVLTLLELRADPNRAQRPTSTRTLDWAFVVLALLMTLGLWLDIYSHAAFGPDQTVLNPFHMLFYSAGAMLGGLLAFTHFSAVRAGVRWTHTLPQGYGITTFGLLIFGVAGVVDLITHALFGFETGFEATLSPSHVGLFIGWFVIGMTPARAALAQRGSEPFKIGRFLPALIGTSTAISAITTIVIYALLIGGNPLAVQQNRATDDELSYTLSILAQFLQTGILTSFLLWLTVKFRLPRGWATLLYGLFALFMFIYRQDVNVFPILLIAGVLIDVVYALLHPHPGQIGRIRLFGFLAPVILWGVYYGFYIVTNTGGGVWFTPYVWIGSVIQAGFIGAFIAYFMTMNPAPVLTLTEGA